jgi:adiponectin receptor
MQHPHSLRSRAPRVEHRIEVPPSVREPHWARRILSVHRETVNIWSHMLGCAVFLVLCAAHFGQHRAVHADTVIIGGYLLSAAVMLALSAAYHAQCATLAHDFLGISVFVAYSQAASVHYAFYCNPAACGGYLIAVAGLFTACVCMCRSSIPRQSRRFALVAAFGAVPLVHHLLLLRTTNAPLQRAASAVYLRAIAWYGVGFVFFLTKFPECARPGAFDILGRSHQWWHLCVLGGSLEFLHALQMSALAVDRTCAGTPP